MVSICTAEVCTTKNSAFAPHDVVKCSLNLAEKKTTTISLYSKIGMYLMSNTLFGGIDMHYILFHKNQLHVSALFIGHLQVDK